MKRQAATNLRELFNNLNPAEFLTPENKQFYVEVYERPIREIRRTLLWSDDNRQTLYLTGQSGSGKTTALNFLPNEPITEKYIVKRFDGSTLLDLSDVSMIDIFLMLGFNLVEGEATLEARFLERLGQIKGIEEGVLSTEYISESQESQESGQGVKAGIGFQFLQFLQTGVDFFYNYRNAKEHREVTRKALSFKKHELRDLVNEIINDFLEFHEPSGEKDLLVIFNELDHIKDWDTIRELFLTSERTQLLEGLRCRKIISLPVILKTKDFRGKIYFLGMKLGPSPIEPELNLDEEIQEHRKDLLAILNLRVAPGITLITEEAKLFAIENSGGIIRQMMEIIRNAIIRAGDEVEVIDLAAAKAGAEAFRPQLRDSLVTPDRIRLLERIRVTHFFMSADKSDMLLTELFLANQVILYENGNPWCSVNPLIEKTVQTYAARIETYGS